MLGAETAETNACKMLALQSRSTRGPGGRTCRLGNKELSVSYLLYAGPPGTLSCKIINKVLLSLLFLSVNRAFKEMGKTVSYMCVMLLHSRVLH